eukprot:TRINITY_DN23518_c0_g1_i2.p1 TRINITY_DN23518_c0_g1~~TRINITY_DN23518_c0_g1_i2.p1  ORF type:complete len:541 (+),score=116.44 TRINITY_DN23518_c0_g1_i2:128-1750(+)
MKALLPQHLRDRLRIAAQGATGALGGRPVVYWMRSCLRAHENAALDAAILAAAALQTWLVVLLHIEDQYPHASARRQMFLLQGACAAQEELQTRGLQNVVVQVDRRGNRDVHLDLVRRAALVVAEEPFCVPWLRGVQQLLKDPEVSAAVWLLDCASVVPSALVPRGACHRAYAYEKSTQALHSQYLAQPWEDAHVPKLATRTHSLPDSLDLGRADLLALMQEMDVDASVAPVEHTLGGSAEGYARWDAWVAAGGLKTYAKRRNESLDVHGVSRMSAYLNTGMVSPLRIARLASTASGAGKGKFLNEFLTWRGLSYAHFYHNPMPAEGATLAQLPPWAQQTLREHASDPRKVVSLAQLAACKSGDKSWDGMQRYLVETGELHNNARMGWGKAVARWSESPQRAIEALVALNNRFALDGHAPPSYGGLLGCLGLFEGPKQDGAVLGKVSFKPPKAKYAAMPTMIEKLQAQRLTPDASAEGPEASAERLDQKRPDIRHFLANSEAAEMKGASDTQETAPRAAKRRWTKRLLPAGEEAICIHID